MTREWWLRDLSCCRGVRARPNHVSRLDATPNLGETRGIHPDHLSDTRLLDVTAAPLVRSGAAVRFCGGVPWQCGRSGSLDLVLPSLNTMIYYPSVSGSGLVGFFPRRGGIQCLKRARSVSVLRKRKEKYSEQRLGAIHHRISMWSGPRWYYTPLKDWRTRISRLDWIPQPRSCLSGANVSSNTVWMGSRKLREEAGRLAFPPEVVVEVKSLACELPHTYGLPLSRFSMAEIQGEVIRRGLVASIGETTIWRWLSQDAIRPWHHRSWIFPRDPSLPRKPGPSWISMKASGKDSPCATPIACCQRTKRPVFRHGGGNIRPYLQHRAGPCGSSTNTNGVAR